MNSGIALYKPTDTRKKFYARGKGAFSLCMFAQISIIDYMNFAHSRSIEKNLIIKKFLRIFGKNYWHF